MSRVLHSESRTTFRRTQSMSCLCRGHLMKRLSPAITTVLLFLPALVGARASSSDAPSEMVTISAGEFWMGRAEFQWLFDRNTEIERDRLDDKPAHKLYLDSFAIDKYEVTNEQYAAFIKATRAKTPWYWPKGEFPEG